MKRAVGASEPPGAPTIKSQTTESRVCPPAAVQKDTIKKDTPQKKDSPSPAIQNQEISEPGSTQRKQSTTGKPLMQDSPAADHKTLPEGQKNVQEKRLDQASQHKQTKQSQSTAATKQDSGLFGFGSTKSQPAESVTGKMFGFGSSIFSSASTMLTTAVQDQHNTAPPASPKMTSAKDAKSPTAQVLEQQKKPDSTLQTMRPTLGQDKGFEVPSENRKAATTNPLTVKPGESTCPLCKAKLNKGSSDLPNYNTCTQCKNTVCNQCGFNPMPNASEVSDSFLCSAAICHNIPQCSHTK